MSLLVTLACVAGGVALGRWIAKGGAREPDAPALPEGGARAARESAAIGQAAPAAREPDWSAFPCALGDVVQRGGDARWLAGALVLSEGAPAAVLFVAPEAGGDRAVLARPRPNDELLWLEPIAGDDVRVGAEPPTSLEIRGQRYERARRLPLRVERLGAGAPDVGDAVVLAEYTSSGAERLVVLSASGESRAWRGEALAAGQYDVMPSGKTTLGDDAHGG